MSFTRHLFIKRQAETPNFGEIDTKHSGDCHASWRIAQIVQRTTYEIHVFSRPSLEPGPVIVNTDGTLRAT
jgi:hypothetical protein